MSEPRVGVGIFVFRGRNDPHFILGQRKGSHGAGTFALPGGHLEYGESFEECASREAMEETGLELENVRFLTATNSIFHMSKKHYVTIFVMAIAKSRPDGSPSEPKNMEPEKCEGWIWVTLDEMKS
ncbi:hypothetical protein M433DRAFT_33538, partial [Acidomyces richmondensis BFW]